jgi:hypothetical protein
MLLTYSDVRFDPEFSAGEFTFRVPDIDRDRMVDRTESVLAEVDQFARLIETAKLQAGEAGGEDPGAVLRDALQIPPMGGGDAPPPPGELDQGTPPNPAPGAIPGPGN